jgi:hypothetical protein
MKLETTVRIENSEAHFDIFHETHGVYRAELKRYRGRPNLAPPSHIVLVRSVRGWTGSSDQQDLLQKLGQQIDDVVSNAPLFHKDTGSERKSDTTSSPEQ